MEMIYQKKVKVNASYDVIVAGGGVAGCAAAIAAGREGKSVLLIEKSVALGGLATIGLINFFVPMCNGRGQQIIYGMSDEFFYDSIKYGFDTVPSNWKDNKNFQRMVTKFDAPIFSLVLLEKLKQAGVDVCFDTIITDAVTEGKHCKGVIVENKSGTQCYLGKVFVDATGDADLLFRVGVPTVTGKNYHTYISCGTNIDICKEAVETKNVSKIFKEYAPDICSDLHGRKHPDNIEKYDATNADDVNRYLITNQLQLLDKIRNDERTERALTALPAMPQFRTTRRIDGDYTFNAQKDAYRHFDDSVAAICDFEKCDYLYEVPFRVMVKNGFDNIIAAGRCTSAEGLGWDILRVIPVAIITGQVAGIACSQKIDENKPIYNIDVSKLQGTLEKNDVVIHFDDRLVPDQIEDIYVDVGEK